jgi:hypothetical protein
MVKPQADNAPWSWKGSDKAFLRKWPFRQRSQLPPALRFEPFITPCLHRYVTFYRP